MKYDALKFSMAK